jgi:hypothetical protein
LVGESLDEFEAHWRQAMLGDEVAVGRAVRPAGFRPAGWQRAELPSPRPAE